MEEIIRLFNTLDMEKDYFNQEGVELYELLLREHPDTLQPTLGNIAFARDEYLNFSGVSLYTKELGLVAVAACFLYSQGNKEDLKDLVLTLYEYYSNDILSGKKLVTYEETFDIYYNIQELTEEQNNIFNNMLAGTIESLKSYSIEVNVHSCKLTYFMGGYQHTTIEKVIINNQIIFSVEGVDCICDYCSNSIFTNTWGCSSCDYDLCNDCMKSLQRNISN